MTMAKNSIQVLITGGAGYLGSVLSRQLLDRGYAVTVLDNFLYRQNSLMDCCAEEQFQVVRGDCRDERLLTDLLRKADLIIPLAALVGAPLTHDFCAISLSDLLTPWPTIARRLDAVAYSDFVVALYNPKSGRRTRQIVEAGKLLDIDVLDHLILCRSRYVSLRERGLGFSS